MGRDAASELDRHPGNGACRGDLFLHRAVAVPAHHRDRATFKSFVVCGDGNDRLDHLRRAHTLQSRAGLRFSSRRIHLVSPIPGWAGRSHAGRHLRLLGLLQRLLSRRRDQRSGKEYSAGSSAFHSAGCVSISIDECVHSGGGALAGDAARGAKQQRLVCCFVIYAEDLWRLGSTSGDRTGHCHRFRIRLLADAGLFPGSLRGRAGWQLFPSICQSASCLPLPPYFPAGVGSRRCSILFSAAQGRNCRVSGHSSHFAVPGAGRRSDCAADPTASIATALSDVALSGTAVLACAGFLFILFKRENWQKEVRYAAVILLTGILIYLIRAWKHSEWPFETATAET